MKIDKAIEINGGLTQSVTAGIDEEEKEAVQLGIEALKGIKKIRKTFRPYVEALLTGETEE